MLNNRVTFLSRFCCLRSLHVLFPGVCKRRLGESANVGASACFLRHYKGTTFAATVLTIAGDAVRFLYFICDKTSSILLLTSYIFMVFLTALR